MHWEGWTYTLELAGFVLGAIAVTIVVLVWMYRRDQRQLHAVARARVADLVEGRRVRVVGTALSAGETVEAPRTGTKCLACRAWQYSGPDSDDPPADERIVKFRVRDDTGTIAVSIKHVKLHLVGHRITTSAFGREMTKRAGIDVWEDRLEPDQPVAVTGFVLRGDDGELYLAGSEAKPLVISNQQAALV